MDPLEYEFTIAPQLEKDIANYYQALRFSRAADGFEYRDHINSIDQALKKTLMNYFNEWNILMFSRKEQVFSFWLEEFRNIYFSVLGQNQMSTFHPIASNNEKWLLEQIMQKLKAGFLTTGFTEKLNKYNEKYSKRIDKLRERYCAASKVSPNAPDMKFVLGLYDQFNVLFDIQTLTKNFRIFEQKLKGQLWYRGDIIFTYFHFTRDPTHKRYVIHLYLTFSIHMFSNPEHYQKLINQLWQDATQHMGILFDMQVAQGVTPYLLQEDHPFNVVEIECPLDALDTLPINDTGVGEDSLRICIAPQGFTHFNAYSNV